MRRKIFLLPLLCSSGLLLGILGGCAFSDPSKVGLTPFCYDKFWEGPDIPACILKTSTEELKEGIPDPSQELGPAEIVDIALRNNPLTQRSWFIARSNAFLYGASENTLYPSITVQETISITESTVGGPFGVGITNALTGATNSLSPSLNPTINPGVNPNVNPSIPEITITPITLTPTTAPPPPTYTTPTALLPTSGAGRQMQGETSAETAAESAATTAAAAATSTAFYEQTLVSSISVNYLMLDFGGRAAGIESAKQALYSSNWAHDRNIQTTMLNALTTYFLYISYKEQYAAQFKNLEDAKNTLEATQAQYEAGVSPRVDFLQANANYVNTELTLETLYGQMAISMGQLANAMGIPADTQLKIGALPKELPYEKICKDMNRLIETAKNQRPDLKASFADYRQAWANLQAARSAGLPTLTAHGIYERVGFIHDSAFNGNYAQAQVTLNVPIFDGFYYYYNTKSARELVDAAWAQFRSQEETVFLDVVTSYNNFKTALEMMQYSEDLLKYAEEAFQVAFNGYRQGVNTVIDLLTAQVTLANARFTEIQARSQLAISLVSLAYSAGVLYN